MHCNLVNNNYQQASKVLFTFVRNKQFGQLINISPYSLIILNTTNTEFLSIEVCFTDKNSKPLEIDARIDAAKTTSKRVVQKTAKTTGDLIGNKIADKITSVGKTKSKEDEIQKFTYHQKKGDKLLLT